MTHVQNVHLNTQKLSVLELTKMEGVCVLGGGGLCVL